MFCFCERNKLRLTICFYIFAAAGWFCYDPKSTNKLRPIVGPQATNWMRRRNFYVEKCKDAQSIGIVVGTLATAGYLDVVKHIQTLARKRGIRTYLISVGKVNPAKLGNFIDIDCFVFIGCPENNIYTSRDFFKPLLSPFEAELALNSAWHEKYPDFYSVDFKEILPNGQHYQEANDNNLESEFDVSLVSGKTRRLKVTDEEHNGAPTNSERSLERKCNQLMDTNSSHSFLERSWTGLDPSLGQQEPVKIVKGRAGIPLEYTEQ